jgi:predicted site-specific integrase-resolvase
MSGSDSRLMPLEEVAKTLGVSIYSIRRFVAAGSLKSVNIGARVMVPSGAVELVKQHGMGTPRRRTRGQGQSTAVAAQAV